LGVHLGNVTEIYPHGDEVQTVEPWTPPDVMFGLTHDQRREVWNKIDKGMPDGSRYTHASSAKTRAAWKLVVDAAPALSEKQAREIIKTWLKEQVFVSRSYRNPNTCKDEEGLWIYGADEDEN
jgi:hypothetical protein